VKPLAEGDLDLIRALDAEAQLAAEFYTNEIAEDQIEAFKRYYGEPYGDEVEGRSAVVSRETFETVEWTRGDLRRVFSSGGRILELDAQTEVEDEYVEDAADWMQYQFFQENDGFELLSSFIFDGLLQKRGYLACFWKDAEYGAPETKELSLIEFDEAMKDPDIELDEEPTINGLPVDMFVQQMQMAGPEQQVTPEAIRVSVTQRKIVRHAYIDVQSLAPEDMRVNARYADIAAMPCKGHDLRVTVSELIKEYPEHAEDIEESAGANTSSAKSIDERRNVRFLQEQQDPDRARSSSPLVQEVIVRLDWIFFDYDGDGYAELRHVKRLGDIILENEEVAEDPYASWTPNHIPHKWFGLSAHDEVADIERVKTVTTRAALDAMYQAVAPRMGVNTTTVNLADCLTVRPGGIIRINGMANEGLFPITVPDQSVPALAMSEYWDKLAERRTGVQRRAQAMDPDALHDTYRGEKLLQNAASVRKLDKAGQCAAGLKQLFGKMYRLCCDHMTDPRTVRVAKKRDITVDPSKWRRSMKITVHVGLGTGAREEQMAALMAVQSDQIAWVSQFGMSKEGEPGVSPGQVFNLFEEKLRVLGFQTANQFGTEPTAEWTPPPPPPSPEMAKVEADTEAKKAELAMRGQADQAEDQRDMEKMRAEYALKEKQLVAEMELKERQLEAELAMKWRMFLAELAMKERIADKQISAGMMPGGGKPNGGGGGSTSRVNVGGDPG
jgi:hypothetical protein